MTREEAIAVFKGFKFLPREMKAVDMAIKALEQEPVLDKIRAEIDGLPCYFAIHIDKEKVLAIIDKYKAEIEPQESEDKE